jgi:hypothetical protein
VQDLSSANVIEEEQAFWIKALSYKGTKYLLREGSGKINRKAGELTSVLDRHIAELEPQRGKQRGRLLHLTPRKL